MAGQPINPEILPRLDPEYVEFHNKYIAHLPAPHTQPWDPNIRNNKTVPGAADILEVGSVDDYELSKTKVRVFTPRGLPPESGWPAYCWYHGGQYLLQTEVQRRGAYLSDRWLDTRKYRCRECILFPNLHR